MACLRRSAIDGRFGALSCDEEGCVFRRIPYSEYPWSTDETPKADCVLQLQLRARDVADAQQRDIFRKLGIDDTETRGLTKTGPATFSDLRGDEGELPVGVEQFIEDTGGWPLDRGHGDGDGGELSLGQITDVSSDEHGVTAKFEPNEEYWKLQRRLEVERLEAERDEPIEIERLDKYHIQIDDVIVHATDDQERRIVEMSNEQLRNFKRIMGGD